MRSGEGKRERDMMLMCRIRNTHWRKVVSLQDKDRGFPAFASRQLQVEIHSYKEASISKRLRKPWDAFNISKRVELLVASACDTQGNGLWLSGLYLPFCILHTCQLSLSSLNSKIISNKKLPNPKIRFVKFLNYVLTFCVKFPFFTSFFTFQNSNKVVTKDKLFLIFIRKCF